MQVNTPLDQMQVYGIVFMTVGGILCFDMHFFFFFFLLKDIQKLPTVDEEISQVSIQGPALYDPNKCIQLSFLFQPQNS